MTNAIASFAASAAGWQSFYLLVGTAAATLIGLMFIAITFGATLVTVESAAAARAWLDPTFAHFVQVLLTACLMTIPPMTPLVLGVLLGATSALRLLALARVFRHLRAAHRKHNDLELSDWLSGIVVPLACHLALAATGAAFIARRAVAFDGLAVVTLAVLMNGVYGAWELMVWMALVRSRAQR